MSPPSLVDRLLAEGRVSTAEASLLRRLAVRDAHELRALLDDVPLLRDAGLRVDGLRAAVEDLRHPDPGPTASPLPPVAVALPGKLPRQGPPGTCVAHALAACVHAAWPHTTPSAAWLHQRAKANPGEPWPDRTETSLKDAVEALQTHGSVPASSWSWDAGPADGSEPDALGGWRVEHHVVEDRQALVRDLIDALAGGRPVAVTFRTLARTADRLADGTPAHSNLSGRGPGMLGRLFAPPDDAPVVSAHCVCVHGFEPDGRELDGGWFVSRSAPGTFGVGRRGRTEPGRLVIGASYLARHALDWAVVRRPPQSGFP